MSQVSNNNGPLHQDFVPHVARISKLMKTKVKIETVSTGEVLSLSCFSLADLSHPGPS